MKQAELVTVVMVLSAEIFAGEGGHPSRAALWLLYLSADVLGNFALR